MSRSMQRNWAFVGDEFHRRATLLVEKLPPLHRFARGLMRRLMRSHRSRDEQHKRG